MLCLIVLYVRESLAERIINGIHEFATLCADAISSEAIDDWNCEVAWCLAQVTPLRHSLVCIANDWRRSSCERIDQLANKELFRYPGTGVMVNQPEQA
jgi:hypothetical protein